MRKGKRRSSLSVEYITPVRPLYLLGLLESRSVLDSQVGGVELGKVSVFKGGNVPPGNVGR